ncbi:Hypothetical protein AJAP_25345 [Amycolatopsis japonica]|uniref:Uncharacterized protein n=1 Tax=Amycolatopsis japonica TaxID=208439 RepID=A0A075UUR6_9PSEU|nr:Hypothetical protein AJAP_25345 [Amycolatopsis japonica]
MKGSFRTFCVLNDPFMTYPDARNGPFLAKFARKGPFLARAAGVDQAGAQRAGTFGGSQPASDRWPCRHTYAVPL